MPRQSREAKIKQQLEARKIKGKDDAELEAALSEVIRNLPPEFFMATARTPQQVLECRKVKEHFRRVAATLDSYFSGEAPPKYELLPRQDKEHVTDEVFLILDFYTMVWANWDVLAEAYQEYAEHPPRIHPAYRQVYKDGEIQTVVSYRPLRLDEIDTPGKALSEFCKYRAMGYIVHAFSGDYHLTPNAIRETVKSLETDADKRTYADDKRVNDLITMNPSMWFEVFTRGVIVQSEPKGSRRRAFKRYQKSSSEMNRLGLSMNHRSKKAPGYHSEAS